MTHVTHHDPHKRTQQIREHKVANIAGISNSFSLCRATGPQSCNWRNQSAVSFDYKSMVVRTEIRIFCYGSVGIDSDP